MRNFEWYYDKLITMILMATQLKSNYTRGILISIWRVSENI